MKQTQIHKNFRFNFSFKTKDFSLFDKSQTEMIILTFISPLEFREEWTILTHRYCFKDDPLCMYLVLRSLVAKKLKKELDGSLEVHTYTLCLLKKTNQSASDLCVILCKCQIYLPVSAYQILRKGGDG